MNIAERFELTIEHPGRYRVLENTPEYIAPAPTNINELKAYLDYISSLMPGSQAFLTLDHPAQASYTSYHCAENNGLLPKPTEDELLEILNTDTDSTPKGYTTMPQSFYQMIDSCRRFVHQIDENKVFDKKFSLFNENLSLLAQIKKSPFEVFWLETCATYVPVDTCYEATFALPNGYFTSDMQFEQTYTVAKHLFEIVGLKFIGIGSSFMGFYRETPITKIEAEKIGTFLDTAYEFCDATVKGLNEECKSLLTNLTLTPENIVNLFMTKYFEGEQFIVLPFGSNFTENYPRPDEMYYFGW